MHRRPLGRGRRLAILSASVVVAGCLLPWYTALGGESGLPAREFRAFDGSGILAFFAALVVVALATLPYAAGDRPVAIDRWVSYLVATMIAAVGLLVWPADMLSTGLAGFLPDRAPGYWLAALGAVGLARATFEIATERPAA